MNPIPKPVAYMHRWPNGDPVVTFTPTLLGASDTQALYASPVVTPKDGWVLAPLTPTEVMIFAGVRQWDGTPADAYQIEVCKATYRAMLDAIDASPDAHDIRQINPDSLFANSKNSSADTAKVAFAQDIEDAKRYRWLRDSCNAGATCVLCMRREPEEWADEIDRAMRSEAKES